MTKRRFCLNLEQRTELIRMLEEARKIPITDEMIQEQRISFAYGNAPYDSEITKDDVRRAASGFCIMK